MKKFLIGQVGVDSGQLMVCDPCYIDSEWKDTEFRPNERADVTLPDGTGYMIWIRVNGVLKARYDDPQPELGGKSVNEASKTEGWKVEVVRDHEPTREFSYDGACRATMEPPHAGQLDYELGHPGVAVSFSAGYGDGVYDVFGYVNDEGRIVRVVIEMG